MTYPRSRFVNEGEIGIYHCYNRCVRRSRLCGLDPNTGRDYSHRKAWIVERLQFLASVFAVDVCSYVVMDTHLHEIIRTRPDIAATWSDREVASRWVTLRPSKKKIPIELQISALIDCPKRIAELRKRLCSLSWFMAQLHEYISRRANKEDGITGHFWEGRYKCTNLLDDAAVASGMVYVDLNLIRAGLADTPEESDFTSIQERIRFWIKNMTNQDSISSDTLEKCTSGSAGIPIQNPDKDSNPTHTVPTVDSNNACKNTSELWLCPIQTTAHREGILQMTEAEYFNLVDRSGRFFRPDKRGAIDPALEPILKRIGIKPRAWQNTISGFQTKFRLAAGTVSNLRAFARKLGKHWLTGVAAAKESFSSAPLRVEGLPFLKE
jgi:hypothetical protein